MPLTLITGPPNSGKTGRVYGRLRQALESGARCVLLLPSLPDVERANAEFTETGLVGLKIVQFDRYLGERWATRGDGRAILTDLQRDALVKSAMKVQGGYLAERADSPGMSALLARLVRDSAAAPMGPPVTGEQAQEVVATALRYRASLSERGFVEPYEAFAELAADLHEDHDILVAHRFAVLAPHQVAYLRSAARAGAEVLVTLTWVPDSSATSALTPLVEQLHEESVHETVTGSYGSTRELEDLASNLFRPGPGPAREPHDVRFCLCEEIEDEIEFAAGEASSAVREGVSAEHVAIVYREPWSKALALRRALADKGLSCDFDIERPLRSYAIGRAALHLLDFAMSRSRSELLAWLRSPFSGASLHAVARLEHRWRLQREEGEQELCRDVREASRATATAVEMATAMASAPVGPEWASRFDTLMAVLMSAAHSGENQLRSELAEDARAVGRMAQLVRDATQVVPPLNVGDVLSALASMRVGPGRTERPGHVQIASVERVRSRRFAVVILGGLTADEFPAGDWDDPGTTGAVGQAARALGISAREDRDAWERADFFSVATRARRRLTLLTHEVSPDGEPLAPSPFWSEALALFAADDAEAELPAFVQRPAGKGGAWKGTPRTLAERLKGCAAAETGRESETTKRREIFSPGELEAYLACPAKWFRDRMLRPETPDARFTPLESGRLIHDVLRETIAELQDTGHVRVTPQTLPLAEKIASAIFERAQRRYAWLSGLDETGALERARRMVGRFLVTEAVFAPRLRPIQLEYGFGFGEGEDAPVDVGEGLLLRGRVDRIDDSGGGVVVTDYKSGSVAPLSAFERQGLLQLQLYAAVLRAKGMPVVGAVYRSLRNGKVTGFHLNDAFGIGELAGSSPLGSAEFDELLERAVARAREAAEGIREGRFEPQAGAQVCRNCAMSSACKGAA